MREGNSHCQYLKGKNMNKDKNTKSDKEKNAFFLEV